MCSHEPAREHHNRARLVQVQCGSGGSDEILGQACSVLGETGKLQVWSGMVRQILVRHVGLTEAEALKLL